MLSVESVVTSKDTSSVLNSSGLPSEPRVFLIVRSSYVLQSTGGSSLFRLNDRDRSQSNKTKSFLVGSAIYPFDQVMISLWINVDLSPKPCPISDHVFFFVFFFVVLHKTTQL